MQVEGESKPAPDLKAVGRPRLSSTGHVYAGLSDEEVEVRPWRRSSSSLHDAMAATCVTHCCHPSCNPHRPDELCRGQLD